MDGLHVLGLILRVVYTKDVPELLEISVLWAMAGDAKVPVGAARDLFAERLASAVVEDFTRFPSRSIVHQRPRSTHALLEGWYPCSREGET